jgi:archaellum component FlaC
MSKILKPLVSSTTEKLKTFNLPTTEELMQSNIDELSVKVQNLNKFTSDIHLELQTGINRVADQVSQIQNQVNGLQNFCNSLASSVNELSKSVSALWSK